MAKSNAVFLAELEGQVFDKWEACLDSEKNPIVKAGLSNLDHDIGRVVSYEIERDYGFPKGWTRQPVNLILCGVEIDPDDGELLTCFEVDIEPEE